jgi:hypothetical protein
LGKSGTGGSVVLQSHIVGEDEAVEPRAQGHKHRFAGHIAGTTIANLWPHPDNSSFVTCEYVVEVAETLGSIGATTMTAHGLFPCARLVELKIVQADTPPVTS